MPCRQAGEDADVSKPARSHYSFRSRYNEISAWAVLGLAIRYATFLGLERTAIAPFKSRTQSVSDDDMTRFRIWLNLVTCDCNLMLSSGLPTSLDPAPAASVARRYSSHHNAQQPADLRATALVELGLISHGATRSYGGFSGRQLDSFSLKKANTEFDEWER